MTNPAQPPKPEADEASGGQSPESGQEKHKAKTGDNKISDLAKIIWDRIGPLTIDPMK